MTYFVASPHLLARWVAEPVGNVYIPASSFISNAKHYPVLSKSCQELLRGLLRVRLLALPSRASLTLRAAYTDRHPCRYRERSAHVRRRKRIRSIVRPLLPQKLRTRAEPCHFCSLRFIERKVPQPDPIEQYAGTLYLDHLQGPYPSPSLAHHRLT